MLRNRFELTFVSPSQAIIRDLKAPSGGDAQKPVEEGGQPTGEQAPLGECVLRSKRGAELGEVRVLGRDQRYAIAYTPSTLLLADMWTGLVRSCWIYWLN